MENTTTTPATNPLAVALAAAQKELRNPAKDRTNPYFDSKYATLDALQDASRTILAKHGLSVTQTCGPLLEQKISFDKVVTEMIDKEGNVTKSEGYKVHPFLWELRTTLLHESGVTVVSSMPLICATKGAQQFGGEITYMRRYAYAAILNMTADEDDDGNVAEDKKPEEKPKKRSKKEPDDILGSERTPSPDPGPEVDPWRVRKPTGPVALTSEGPRLIPATQKGPVDTDTEPDEIPGLEAAGKVAEQVLGARNLEKMTMLEQVQAHLDMDGFKEEDLMTLLRQFKLTRAQQIINVENKTLSTVVDRWEMISKRLKDSKKEEIL